MTAGRDRIRGVVRAYPRDDEPPKFNCLADDKSPQPVDALGDGAVGHRQLFGSLAVVMAVMILATACGGEAGDAIGQAEEAVEESVRAAREDGSYGSDEFCNAVQPLFANSMLANEPLSVGDFLPFARDGLRDDLEALAKPDTAKVRFRDAITVMTAYVQATAALADLEYAATVTLAEAANSAAFSYALTGIEEARDTFEGTIDALYEAARAVADANDLYAFADTYDATARVDYHDAVLDALRVAAWSSYALYFSSVYHVIDTASVYLDAAFRDVAALADDAIEVIKDALFRVKTTLVQCSIPAGSVDDILDAQIASMLGELTCAPQLETLCAFLLEYELAGRIS